MQNKLINDPTYMPGRFVDWCSRTLGVRNDARLAHQLGIDPARICRIRQKREAVSPSILLAMHEETGLHVREIRAHMFCDPV